MLLLSAVPKDCLAGCFATAPNPICPVNTATYAVVPPVAATSFTWTLTSDTAGTSFVGATNTDTVQVVSATPGSFSIQCVVASGTNFLTCATNVTVLQPVSLTPLTNQTVCPSSATSFHTTATGSGPLSYQWKRNGLTINGATADTLILTNISTNNAGDYSIEVNGPCGSATNAATLALVPPPTITCPTNVVLSCIGDLPAPDTKIVVVDPASAVIYVGSVTEVSNCLTTITRLYQVVSSCGTTSACEQVFQIVNTNAPIISCATNRTVECGADWSFDDPTAVGFCGDTNVTIEIFSTESTPLCGSSYSTTRTWRATDSCSNTAFCSQTITIADTTAPVITCGTNRSVECGTEWTFDTPAVSDVCAGTNVTLTFETTTNALVGQLFSATRTWHATDGCSNSASCSQTITVVDTTPPVINCSSNLVVECTGLSGTPAVFYTTAQDACDTNVLVVCNPPSGSLFAVGTNLVICTATDQSGNTNVCSFTVTVKVTSPPQVICPSNLVAECAGPAGTPVAFTVSALGLCDTNVVVTSTPPSGYPFPLGTNVITSVASDEYGNSNSCTFTVTVLDTTPPQITCPPKLNVAEVPRDSGSALVTFSQPTASDSCSTNVTVTSQPASGTFFPVGSNTVVSTAADPSGNTNSCSFIVRVIPYHLFVSNTADAGPGSLRQAILDANDAPGENLITFSLADSNNSTIHLSSPLPEITSPVIVDGTTSASLTPAVAVDGGGGTNTFDGLVISAGNSTIRGLSLYGFATAIRLTGGTNIVQANYVGADLTGGNFIGNSGDGIFIDSARNLIGGATNGLGNVIGGNGHNGITVNSGVRNALLENIIINNGALGIDLGNDGVTLNDDGDVDSGANNLQNFPVLTDAVSADGTTTINGTLTSDINQSMRVEFYLNDLADPSGYGEGQQYIGSTVFAVHGSGPESFTASFPLTATFTQFVTAIATDQRGNSSEFSQALQVRTPPVLGAQPTSTNAPLGGSATFCATATGTPPIYYQWRLNGVNIPDATNSCYTIPASDVGNLGTYTVIVGNQLGAVGTASASLDAPLTQLNGADYFSGRVPLSGLSGTVQGDNHNATSEPGEPLHAGKVGGRSVWYTWTAPVTGVATFRTVGSAFNTLLGVYIGTNVTNLVTVISDVDHGGFYTSSARFNVQKNAVVAIAIDGFGGAEGEFVLSWEEEDTPKLLPYISVHPESQTVLPGSDVRFFVVAQRTCGYGHTNCPAPTHYPGDEIPQLTNQWYFNGVQIAGATSTSLSITNVGTNDLGAYHMRVATPYQYVDSHDAILQINVTGGDSQDVQAFDKLLDSELSEALHIGVPPPTAGRSGSTGSTGGTALGSSIVRGFTGTQIFNTTGSATSPGETICGVIGGASEWITFVADTSGTLFLSTDGSSYDTVMAVFKRSATNANVLEQITCDNNSGVDGKDSAVNFPVQAGSTNYIVVDGVNGVTGILQLNYSLVTSTVIKMLAPTIQGQQHLQVVGRTNLNFTLQCSTNMQSWTSLFTTNAPTGTFDYVDPASAGMPARYYRAILLP